MNNITESKHIEKPKRTAEQEENVILVAILVALSREMISGDVWYLAMSAAQEMATKAGVDPDKVEEVLLKVLDSTKRNHAKNPMMGSFMPGLNDDKKG